MIYPQTASCLCRVYIPISSLSRGGQVIEISGYGVSVFRFIPELTSIDLIFTPELESWRGAFH